MEIISIDHTDKPISYTCILQSNEAYKLCGFLGDADF